VPRSRFALRSARKSTLPRRVRGNSFRNSTSRGQDHLISRSRQCANHLRKRRARSPAGPEHDKRLDPLALGRVRHADHADRRNGGVLANHLLHFRGIDVEAEDLIIRLSRPRK